MTRNQFLVWAEPLVRNFLYLELGKPSIDRIDPDGHYEFGNMRVIDEIENRRRSRFICSYLRLKELDGEAERIEAFAANIVATCGHAGISVGKLASYLLCNPANFPVEK